MERSTLLKQGAMCVGIYLLLLLITIFIPVVELITLFLLPLPFIFYTAKFGWKPGSLTALVALLFAFLITIVSLPFSLLACLGGVLSGSAIHQKLSPYETWARGTVGYLLGLTGSFLFIQVVFNINIVSEMRSAVQSSIQTTRETMETVGISFGNEEIDAVTSQMESLIDLLPVILVAVSLLLGFITQWLGYKLLNRFADKQLKFPPFREFRLPVAVIWFYFAAILLTIFTGEDNGSVYLAAVNITNMAGLLVAIQGLSLIFFYAYKKKRSKALPIIAILIVVFFPFIGLYLMRILGIIDLGFSLRDRIKGEE